MLSMTHQAKEEAKITLVTTISGKLIMQIVILIVNIVVKLKVRELFLM